MWPLCTANNFLWILLPLLIGLLTGWWIWANRKKESNSGYAMEPAAEAATTVPATANEGGRPALSAVPLRPDHVAMGPHGANVAEEPEAAHEVNRSGAAAIGIAPAVGDPDDLKRIKGIGPKLDDLLRQLGVIRFDQIAAWTSGDVAKVDRHLGAFRGRIERDRWIEQAILLAGGAFDEFEAQFGGNGSTDE